MREQLLGNKPRKQRSDLLDSWTVLPMRDELLSTRGKKGAGNEWRRYVMGRAHDPLEQCDCF